MLQLVPVQQLYLDPTSQPYGNPDYPSPEFGGVSGGISTNIVESGNGSVFVWNGPKGKTIIKNLAQYSMLVPQAVWPFGIYEFNTWVVAQLVSGDFPTYIVQLVRVSGNAGIYSEKVLAFAGVYTSGTNGVGRFAITVSQGTPGLIGNANDRLVFRFMVSNDIGRVFFSTTTGNLEKVFLPDFGLPSVGQSGMWQRNSEGNIELYGV